MGENPKPVVESAIMEATRGALAEHGYAELDFEAVAARCEYDRSLIDLYYDDPGDLVVHFLTYERDRFEEFLMLAPEEPDLRLRVLLESLVGLDDIEADGLLEPMVELSSQALSDDELREALYHLDAVKYEALVETIEAGIEERTFRGLDPDLVAAAVFAVRDATLRQEAYGQDATLLRDALDAFVLSRLRRNRSETQDWTSDEFDSFL
jgi:AcrR family transcriptional regulator